MYYKYLDGTRNFIIRNGSNITGIVFILKNWDPKYNYNLI